MRIYIYMFFMSVSIWSQIAIDNEVEIKSLRLEQFIEYVAKATNKTILYDEFTRGKIINIANPQLKTKEDLIKMLHSVLEYKGYIVQKIKLGQTEVLKIKRSLEGPWTSTSIFFTKKELDEIANQDLFITMVIKLKYISVREVQTTLRALRIVNPQGGNLGGMEGSNTLLITDYASNVKRVYSVIEQIDRKKENLENLEISDKIFAIENKTIPISLNKDETYGMGIELNKNVLAVVKDENDNIIMATTGAKAELWLNHHLKNSASKKFHIELEILKDDHSEITVRVFEKNADIKNIWNFAVYLPLPKNKKIKFTLAMSVPD